MIALPRHKLTLLIIELEVDHGPSNLEDAALKVVLAFIFVEVVVSNAEDWEGLHDFDKRTKLGAIVIQDELVIHNSDVRVDPGYTDISNLHICLYRPADLELILRVVCAILPELPIAVLQVEDMDDLRRSAFDRLKDHVVLRFVRQIEHHDLKHTVLHPIFEGFLAKLALERFPEEGLHFASFVN